VGKQRIIKALVPGTPVQPHTSLKPFPPSNPSHLGTSRAPSHASASARLDHLLGFLADDPHTDPFTLRCRFRHRYHRASPVTPHQWHYYDLLRDHPTYHWAPTTTAALLTELGRRAKPKPLIPHRPDQTRKQTSITTAAMKVTKPRFLPKFQRLDYGDD
jgi:hypothetical protein